MEENFSQEANKREEIKIVDGVYERRYFLQGIMAAAAATALSYTVRASHLAEPFVNNGSMQNPGTLAWDEFIKQAVPVAQQLVADPGYSVDEYLFRIGSLATRLKELPDSKLGPYTDVDKRVWFGPSFRGKPFLIIQWRMDPDAVLPPHNHPNAAVCTLGFEGVVQLRNFEIVGEAPDYAAKKSFLIRETRNERMTSGRISTLSPSRDNIHTFSAGKEGARGIDINTMVNKSAPFSFLNMNEKPIDADKGLYEVSWNPELGQPKSK